MRGVRQADPNELPRAVAEFRSLILEGEPPDAREIAYALDKLTMLAMELPDCDPAESDAEPPQAEGAPIWGCLTERFPRMGFYAMADPLEIEPTAPMMGHAIDDLSDILRDLAEVAWRAENLGIDDAVWHFQFLYGAHWGHHARSLTPYLYALAF